MRLRAAERLLRRALVAPLDGLGFCEPQELIFAKAIAEGQQVITIAPRLKDGTPCFTVGFGVEFPSVNRLVDIAEPYMPTIGVPIDLLRPAPGFTEWCFQDEQGARRGAGEALNEIRDYGLPFLEKVSGLSAVRGFLESNDPIDWFSLTPTQRIETLAAISAVQGRTNEARGIVTRALSENPNGLPKERRPLERLLERLSHEHL